MSATIRILKLAGMPVRAYSPSASTRSDVCADYRISQFQGILLKHVAGKR